MTTAAAAAWVKFAAGSAAALQQRQAGAAGSPDALGGDLAVAVDGASAQSLAPLVPAQLLAAAMGALQARLAHLHEALASVFAGLEGGEGAAAVAVADDAEGSESGGGGSGFSADMEAVLADALQVRRAQAAFHCCGGR